MVEYEVEITSEGRSGNVLYKEQEGCLNFWWEFSADGAFINIPSNENWDNFCERSNASWGKDRKLEIVQRVASETKRQKAPSAEIEIQDEWINLYF